MQTCFIFFTYPPFKLNAFDTTGPSIPNYNQKLVYSYNVSYNGHLLAEVVKENMDYGVVSISV